MGEEINLPTPVETWRYNWHVIVSKKVVTKEVFINTLKEQCFNVWKKKEI